MVELLLEQKDDQTTLEEPGCSLDYLGIIFSSACYGGLQDIARRLLLERLGYIRKSFKEEITAGEESIWRRKDDSLVKDDCGPTALWLACENGHDDAVKLLSEYTSIRTNINQLHKWDETWCIWKGTPYNMGALVLWNFYWGMETFLSTSRIKKGITALMYACTDGNNDTVKLLLERADIDIDTTDKSGKTVSDYSGPKTKEPWKQRTKQRY
ncbi:hypothetical protein FPQ18DRAFT_301496 [Pyronema domesticum]|nr:hypothetical protein FPQ18DRAFT_301496 [Pyronema domesticum]